MAEEGLDVKEQTLEIKEPNYYRQRVDNLFIKAMTEGRN